MGDQGLREIPQSGVAGEIVEGARCLQTRIEDLERENARLLEIAEAVGDATVVGTIQCLSCHEELGGPYWATVEMGGETRVTVEEGGDTRLEAIAAALREATACLREALEIR